MSPQLRNSYQPHNPRSKSFSVRKIRSQKQQETPQVFFFLVKHTMQNSSKREHHKNHLPPLDYQLNLSQGTCTGQPSCCDLNTVNGNICIPLVFSMALPNMKQINSRCLVESQLSREFFPAPTVAGAFVWVPGCLNRLLCRHSCIQSVCLIPHQVGTLLNTNDNNQKSCLTTWALPSPSLHSLYSVFLFRAWHARGWWRGK